MVLAVIPSISVAYVTAVAWDTPVRTEYTDSVSFDSSYPRPPGRLPTLLAAPIEF